MCLIPTTCNQIEHEEALYTCIDTDESRNIHATLRGVVQFIGKRGGGATGSQLSGKSWQFAEKKVGITF